MNKIEKVYTPVGVVTIDSILQYCSAEEIDPAYSAYDLYIQFETPGSRSESGLRRTITEVIIPNFVPDDYAHYEKDHWSYGGIRSEGHYTTMEVDEDLTTNEWIQEYVDKIDIINELKSAPKELIIDITEKI